MTAVPFPERFRLERLQRAHPRKALFSGVAEVDDWLARNALQNQDKHLSATRVLLDETGGPNHVGNFCFAPVHADTKTGELIYTNSYYYIGHFSKFVRPGARRIACSPSRSQLLSTAFVNPDGKVSVVVMNKTDQKVSYQLWMDGNAAEVSSPPHSIQTLVL